MRSARLRGAAVAGTLAALLISGAAQAGVAGDVATISSGELPLR